MLRLFHSEIYVPTGLKPLQYTGELRYSRHAREEASSDKYGLIDLPGRVDAERAQLIEVEARDGPLGKGSVVTKQVWRQPLDAGRDIVLVVQPDGFVRTVWVNLRSDTHKSLNRSRYMPAPRLPSA